MAGVSIRFPEATHRRVQRLAEERGESFSLVVRELVRRGLGDLPPEDFGGFGFDDDPSAEGFPPDPKTIVHVPVTVDAIDGGRVRVRAVAFPLDDVADTTADALRAMGAAIADELGALEVHLHLREPALRADATGATDDTVLQAVSVSFRPEEL